MKKKLAGMGEKIEVSAAERDALARKLGAAGRTLEEAQARAAELNKSYETLLTEKTTLGAVRFTPRRRDKMRNMNSQLRSRLWLAPRGPRADQALRERSGSDSGNRDGQATDTRSPLPPGPGSSATLAPWSSAMRQTIDSPSPLPLSPVPRTR